MSKGKIVAVLVVVLIVIVGFAMYKKSSDQAVTVDQANQNSQTGAPQQEPQPTGNVDEAAAAILMDIDSDEVGADIDAAAVAENDSAIDSLGQSLDGSQF